MCLFYLRCYLDSIRSYFTHLCFKAHLFLHLSLRLRVVARSVVNIQHSTGCLVVCFPGMTSSLAKSKQIGCTLSYAFFLKFSFFDVPQYSNTFKIKDG